MLVKLLPENITANWDQIKYAIEQSLPPTIGEGIDKMNRILEALLAGSLVCWVQCLTTDEGTKIYSIGTTKINKDDASNTKSLLIYSVYNFLPMTDSMWEDNLMTLREYARSNGCTRVIAFTDVKRIMDIAVKVGGNISYTLCSIPV